MEQGHRPDYDTNFKPLVKSLSSVQLLEYSSIISVVQLIIHNQALLKYMKQFNPISEFNRKIKVTYKQDVLASIQAGTYTGLLGLLSGLSNLKPSKLFNSLLKDQFPLQTPLSTQLAASSLIKTPTQSFYSKIPHKPYTDLVILDIIWDSSPTYETILDIFISINDIKHYNLTGIVAMHGYLCASYCKSNFNTWKNCNNGIENQWNGVLLELVTQGKYPEVLLLERDETNQNTFFFNNFDFNLVRKFARAQDSLVRISYCEELQSSTQRDSKEIVSGSPKDVERLNRSKEDPAFNKSMYEKAFVSFESDSFTERSIRNQRYYKLSEEPIGNKLHIPVLNLKSSNPAGYYQRHIKKNTFDVDINLQEPYKPPKNLYEVDINRRIPNNNPIYAKETIAPRDYTSPSEVYSIYSSNQATKIPEESSKSSSRPLRASSNDPLPRFSESRGKPENSSNAIAKEAGYGTYSSSFCPVNSSYTPKSNFYTNYSSDRSQNGKLDSTRTGNTNVESLFEVCDSNKEQMPEIKLMKRHKSSQAYKDYKTVTSNQPLEPRTNAFYRPKTSNEDPSVWACPKCGTSINSSRYDCTHCRYIDWDKFYSIKSRLVSVQTTLNTARDYARASKSNLADIEKPATTRYHNQPYDSQPNTKFVPVSTFSTKSASKPLSKYEKNPIEYKRYSYKNK